MPKKVEYMNPDGSIGYIYNWTEEKNKVLQEGDEAFANSEKGKKFLEERTRRLEEILAKSREERKNKNK